MTNPTPSARNPQNDSCAHEEAGLTSADDQPIEGSAWSRSADPVTVMRGQHVLGTASLFMGAAVLVLAAIDANGELPFRMPRSWYAERPLWCGLAMLSIGAGGYLLHRRAGSSDESVASRQGVRFSTAKLYTRANCHLCEEASVVLRKYARYLPDIQEIDVDAQDQTAERFGDCVPVLELDGKIRFRGRVNEVLLRRLIVGALPNEAGPQAVK